MHHPFVDEASCCCLLMFADLGATSSVGHRPGDHSVEEKTKYLQIRYPVKVGCLYVVLLLDLLTAILAITVAGLQYPKEDNSSSQRHMGPRHNQMSVGAAGWQYPKEDSFGHYHHKGPRHDQMSICREYFFFSSLKL
ncbi:hypothetical protein RIF29_20448 [Crotalaria pallida]|uniref:Uncharacterized protein n=1 Tax=Crotalaria pallida TaxID=3830 RepID=A0AAN9F300_CROPI